MANINNHSLEIYVNGIAIDLFDEGVNLRLNKVLTDPTKIATNPAEYSFTFNLPITDNNAKAFNYANISSKRNKFSGRYPADVYADNILIFSGTIKVTSIEEGQFKCNLFKTKVNTLESIFGETTMSEINWKVPFKGVSTINEVNANPDTKYFFPFVAYSLFNKLPDITTGSGNRRYTDKYVIDYTNVFYYNSFIPSMNLVELLKKCCELKGFNLSGDIITDRILNSIYLSNYISDEQDPLYNYGDSDMGTVELSIDWKNYNGTTMDTTNMTEYPLGFIPRTREEPLSGYNNYDTAFVWNTLSSTNSTTTVTKNNSKMYVNGGIQVPASGFYEITMNMDIGIPTTQGDIKAQICTDYMPAGSAIVGGEEVSWDESRKYKDVTINSNTMTQTGKYGTFYDNMPIEIQLCRYDTDDGNVNNINHNIIYFGSYPNESDYQAKITDINTGGIRVGVYTNDAMSNLSGLPSIDANPSAVAIDIYNNPDFVCGMSQSTYGRNFAYIKDGYSWHSDYQDISNSALYNMNGYYFTYTDFDLSGGIFGFTTGYTTSDVNANSLIGGGAYYPSPYGRRTKGELRCIVRLNKNDMLIPFAQTRGYYITTGETTTITNPVIYQADAKIDLKIRAVAPQYTSTKKLQYNMSSLFDKNLNLGNFNNNKQKISEFINDIQKAFNLSFQQDGNNIILNKQKINDNISAPVDIDNKVNTMDAVFNAIDFPRSIEVKYKIDTEEEGFYRSVEENTNEEQMQSNNWKDFGDYGYEKVNISQADDSTDISQSLNFSYCWYQPFEVTTNIPGLPPINPTPSPSGSAITVTLTGEINRTSVGTDVGCDSDGDGIDELFKPQSIIFDSNIQYTISGISTIPDVLKFKVKSSRIHLGKHMEGTETYTPTDMSGTLTPPSATDLITDRICYQVEQMLSIEDVEIYLTDESEYSLTVVDNINYTDDSHTANSVMTLAAVASVTPRTSGVVNIPVIGKTEWWIEGYKYEEMAKNDGRGMTQRMWFRNSPSDIVLPVQGEQYYITTTSNDKIYPDNNEIIYLNYKNGVNTLLGKYFNADVDSGGDEVEIEVYLTPDEYKHISMGSSVHFDDNLYKVLEIQGYDPMGKNPTKLKLLSY
jgi:hypothetical protein